MENPTQAFESPLAEGPFPRGSKLPDHWRMARAAHVDLLLMGMPRVNLLLIAADGVVRYVIESLLLDLQEPIERRKPGEHLTLPSPSDGGTLVIHDVGSLSADDQLRLLDWLERAEGRTQVVSTSATQLLPRVESGTFIDTLYYRLNTVCVDVST
jgi:transcriptional regulator of aromatic amino acid metabolism